LAGSDVPDIDRGALSKAAEPDRTGGADRTASNFEMINLAESICSVSASRDHHGSSTASGTT
jgi:hypothetical protein